MIAAGVVFAFLFIIGLGIHNEAGYSGILSAITGIGLSFWSTRQTGDSNNENFGCLGTVFFGLLVGGILFLIGSVVGVLQLSIPILLGMLFLGRFLGGRYL